MNKFLATITIVMSFWGECTSQIIPSNHATVNYRLAGFSVPENTKAKAYLFEIVKDSVSNEGSFDKKLTIEKKAITNRCVILLPSFGAKYTWRVSYLNESGVVIGKTGLYHFSTGMIRAVDTSLNGISVLQKPVHHKEMLLLLDAVFVIYDMDGSPVWYMPEIPEIKGRGVDLRDFKATSDGTFTIMTATDAYEIDYNGKIIWRAPNDGKVSGANSELYHHELTKLSNGHYMVIGAETLWRKIPADPNLYFVPGDTTVKQELDSNYYKKIICSTLIEYDSKGEVIWTWKSSEYLKDVDYFRPRKNLDNPYDSRTYLNAFEFDQVNKVIYVSFKNINRVLKIGYPSGKILNSYGEVVNADLTVKDYSPFYGQHNVRIDKKTNNLYLYDNNYSDFKRFTKSNMDADGSITSHVKIFEQSQGNELKEIWNLPCKLQLEKGKPHVSTRGGSVNMLNDDCIFISMGTLNHLMIVSRDKKIIWDAAPYTTEAGKKIGMIPYRSSWTDKKDIERAIFKEIEITH